VSTRLYVAFWCRINGSRFRPGDDVTVENDDQAATLIRDGLCRRWEDRDDPDQPTATGDGQPPEPGWPSPDAPSAGNELDAAGSSGQPAGDGRPPADGSPATAPDPAASKTVWTRYAVAQGMSEDEAKATPKADLIARYAAV
jgi:hypothetical protein